jgi:hypothetical protein
MWHSHNSVLRSISKALHAHYDHIEKEPLPQRWVDLIRYLDEKEQRTREASRSDTDEPGPPPKPHWGQPPGRSARIF